MSCTGTVRGGLGRGEHLVHQRLNAALSGENVDNALQVENNQVVLDLSNLITQVKQRLVDRGLTVARTSRPRPRPASFCSTCPTPRRCRRATPCSTPSASGCR